MSIMDNIPPLQKSSLYPHVIGSKRNIDDDDLNNHISYSFLEEKLETERTTPEISNYERNGKYIMDITEKKRIVKMDSKTGESTDDEQKNPRTHSKMAYELKRVGTCYVMVRKPPKENVQAIAVDHARSSLTSLPGAMDYQFCVEDNQSDKKEFSEKNSVLNLKYQSEQSKNILKFTATSSSVLQQMQKFSLKIEQAIVAELKYLKHLDDIKEMYASRRKNMQQSFSGDSIYDELSNEGSVLNAANHSITLPKLGKVYVELQMHFNIWNDLMLKFERARLSLSISMMRQLTMLHDRIEKLHTKILFYVQKLIETRLKCFACCSSVRAKHEEAEREWSAVFGTGSLKRFCKLIEVYNKLIRKSKGFQSKSSITSYRTHPHVGASSTFIEKNTPQVFTVPRIVSCLSKPVKNDLAICLLRVLLLILQNEPNEGEFEEKENVFHDYKLDWRNADDVEMDEDQVITHVDEMPVHSLPDTKLSNDCLSGVKQLLYAQGSFIFSFLNCLAGNTSLLRRNLRSKSPCSVSSQYFGDTIGSVNSSDEEGSSIASSSFYSQLSGTGGLSSPRKRKTVLWRDSWDHEAVKSLSKSYIADLVTNGSFESLLGVLSSPSKTSKALSRPSEQSDGCLLNPQSALKVLFRSDIQVLLLEASITNMITTGLLPEDILESLLESTHSFIIQKALSKWDDSMSEALAIGSSDKCGGIEFGGRQSLTKTACLYVAAVNALMFIMDRYNDREDVAQEALPRLSSTLHSFYVWCYGKIQQLLGAWSLRPLLQVTLGDLSHLTALGLDCLPLVEKLHNYVESRRVENPATLHLATNNLGYIDGIITNMQSLSGECMKMYSNKCDRLSKESIESTFPPLKLWRQKNLTDHGPANSYIEKAVSSVIQPVCSAVSELDVRSQLSSAPPAVSSLMNALAKHICDRKVQFSVQGAVQLQHDFEHIIDFICSPEAGMCREVKRGVLRLPAFKRSIKMCKTLQRTDLVADKGAKSGYEASKADRRASSLEEDNLEDNAADECPWMLSEQKLLQLRVKSSPKKLFSLPCSND